jgi:putative tricarboxylic transport membrane protein
MKLNDAVIGVLLAALGIAILLHVQGYPTIPGQKYGPALFPGLAAAGLVACGALLVRRGIRSGASLLVLAPWVRSPRHAANFLLVVAALAFYIAAAEPLGFLPTGFLILAVLFRKFGARSTLAAPVALVATLVIHFLFYKMMRVPLPWGVLQPLAW